MSAVSIRLKPSATKRSRIWKEVGSSMVHPKTFPPSASGATSIPDCPSLRLSMAVEVLAGPRGAIRRILPLLGEIVKKAVARGKGNRLLFSVRRPPPRPSAVCHRRPSENPDPLFEWLRDERDQVSGMARGLIRGDRVLCPCIAAGAWYARECASPNARGRGCRARRSWSPGGWLPGSAPAFGAGAGKEGPVASFGDRVIGRIRELGHPLCVG